MEKIKTQNIECAFRIVYIVHLLLAFNAVINRTFIVKVSLVITMILGIGVGIIKLWNWKRLSKHQNFWLLNLFIISFLLSAVLNYHYGISGNLKGFVWLCIQIWLLYLWIDGEDVRTQIKYIGNVFVTIVTVENIVNFILFFIGYTYRHISADGSIHMLGFHWGRLWGIYDDPNHGAAISVLAVAFALYFLSENYKKKKWYLCSIIFQVMYIYWSDSRTGIYGLALLVILWGIILCINKYKEFLGKKIIGSIIAVGVAVLIIALTAPVQSASGEIRNKTKFIYEKYCLEESADQLEEDEKVGREENASDPSNRRFSIWESGIEIWETNPVIGVSWANLTNYAEKELPETYIVNNDLQKFYSLHNMIMDVLVGQGIVGIVLLIGIIINTLIFSLKKYKVVSDENRLLCGSLFVVMCISFFISLFISSIFYINSPESYVFWLAFGGYMSILRNDNKRSEVRSE